MNRQTLIKNIAKSISVLDYVDYRVWLTQLYKEMKSQISPYSKVKFSEDLGLGANPTLQLILANKRRLTRSSTQKIIAALGFRKEERRFLVALVEFGNSKTAGERESHWDQMQLIKAATYSNEVDPVKLEFFGHWYIPVIWELAGRQDFEFDASWIQSTLRFPVQIKDIKKAMEILSRLGLVYFDAGLSRYVKSTKSIDTGTEARGPVFVDYHQEMLELAKKAVTSLQKKNREVTSVTACLTEKDMAVLRKKLQELVREASQRTTDSTDAEVIQLNLQMFSTTRSSI